MFLNFHSSLLKWFANYLTGRRQFVRIGNKVSKVIFNRSGVPQGSHLGPILFLLFINDLPMYLEHSYCLLYADDLKIFKSLNSINDCRLLQEDLNNVSNWCMINRLHFNISKCNILSFFMCRNPIYFNYSIANSELTRVNFKMDLGVIFDHKLNFLHHYDYIIAKANAMLGFLKRNSQDFSDPHALKSMYTSLVRSILEYCCVIWDPYYIGHSKRIENVQKRFTRFAIGKLDWNFSPSYISRCKLLGLIELETRRKYFLIMLARDVLMNHIVCPPLLSLFNIYAPVRSIRSRDFFSIEYHRTNYGCSDTISKSCTAYNSICDVIDLSETRSIFKHNVLNVI